MENPTLEQQQEKAFRTLATMLDYLGLNAMLKTTMKGSNVVIRITSDEAGRIIGRKGQTLENLQLLLNRMLFNGDKTFPRVLLDIDGYMRSDMRPGGREGKREGGADGSHERGSGIDEDQLRAQALDAAKEVKRWGEPVVLKAMNSHDRRIIHITLEGDPELETCSEGEGALKKVIISLKK
ncbi:MAG: KH domain-containing protein [Victivallaceae bacterium]|nr:KH domain-containing protein [Victivallaceae bacterium]